MTRRFTLLMVCGVLSLPLKAQFINLQIRIEPELSATVEQNLNFGTQITNSGRTEIQLGDVNMGVFSIRAIYTQNLYLNLEYPEILIHSQPEVTDEIPLSLNLAYNNSGTNMVANATPLPENNGMVAVHENTEIENRNDIWKQLYIYVYGSIEVGNISNGIYEGNIILTVDYD